MFMKDKGMKAVGAEMGAVIPNEMHTPYVTFPASIPDNDLKHMH
jgi:hypothetical protein